MEASKLGNDDDEEEDEEEEEAAEKVEREIDEGDAELARAVFERGYKDLKGRGEKEDVSHQVQLGRVSNSWGDSSGNTLD